LSPVIAPAWELGVGELGESALGWDRKFSYEVRIYDTTPTKVAEIVGDMKNTTLNQFEFTLLQQGGCADFSFILGQEYTQVTIDYNYRIELYFYGQEEPWYTGFITKVPKKGTDTIYKYSGYGYFRQLSWIRMNETDTVEEVADIIEDTVDDYVVPNTDIVKDASKLDSPIYLTASTLYWERIEIRTCFERLMELADGYKFGVDEERDFYFQAIDTRILQRFWIGKHLTEFKPEEDQENICNRLYVRAGRLNDGSDYVFYVENVASQVAHGLREDVEQAPEIYPTFSATDLASGIVPTSNPAGDGNQANMTDGDPSTIWDSQAAQTIGHYIEIDLGAVSDRIAKVVLNSVHANARDEYARGFEIDISTTGAFAGEEVTVFTSTLLGSTLPEITFIPTQGRYIRITLTINDAAEWHVGLLEVYELDTTDAERWANYRLDLRKDKIKRATAVIDGVDKLFNRMATPRVIKPEGQWAIHDENGNHIDDYQVKSCKYVLTPDSFKLIAELGELKRDMPAQLRAMLQTQKEHEMTGVRNAGDLSSGIGSQALIITSTMIGKEAIHTPHLIANIITANEIAAGAVTAEKISILSHLVSGAVWSDDTPGAGDVQWANAEVTYNGITYAITDGNTSDTYIWWDFSFSTTTFQTANAKPALTDDDFIVCYNNSGTHELVWNQTLIVGGTIRTGSVDTDELAALSVIASKINVVGLDAAGRIVVGDATDADEVTGGINTHATTLILPGKIIISGATNLEDWRAGGDLTKIDGGDIFANSVTATQALFNDLINVSDQFTLAAGRVSIDKDAFGANLEGMYVNDGIRNRVEIGELTAGNYGITIRNADGEVTVNLGEFNLTTKCYVQRTANQLNLADSTETKVQLNVESFDTGNDFDNAVNYRFTAPKDGFYMVHGQIMWTQMVADKQYNTRIYKNGIAGNREAQGTCQPSTDAGGHLSGGSTALIWLDAGDFLELWGIQYSGVGTVDIYGNSGDTFMTIFLEWTA